MDITMTEIKSGANMAELQKGIAAELEKQKQAEEAEIKRWEDILASSGDEKIRLICNGFPVAKLPKVLGSQVLVKKGEPHIRYNSTSIITPESTKQAEKLHIAYGYVLKLSKGAYRNLTTGEYFPAYADPEDRPQVGDFVNFGKHRGLEIDLDGVEFIILRDIDIVTVLDETIDVATYSRVS